jgi:hypothetical protein
MNSLAKNIQEHIQDSDELLLPEESKSLQYEMIDTMYPLLLKIKDKGYLSSLKSSSNNFNEVTLLIGSTLSIIMERFRMHKQFQSKFEPFQNESILFHLNGYTECQSQEEKKQFQQQLLEDLQEV